MVVGNVPGIFFFFFSQTSLVWPFWAVFRVKSEIFRVPNFGQRCPKTRFFSHIPIFHFGQSSSHRKRYIGCPPSGNYNLVIFRHFLNFGSFFGPFLGTVVKNAKHRKVAPGNSLKTLASIFKSLNCAFPKYKFSVPQLNRRGLVWYLLNSSKAQLDKLHYTAGMNIAFFCMALCWCFSLL